MPKTLPNIKLDYRLAIATPSDEIFYSNGAEVFMDEHGIQWIKFVANNGYQKGLEHMVRTEKIVITRRDAK